MKFREYITKTVDEAKKSKKVEYVCPECGKRFKVRIKPSTTEVKCPKCGYPVAGGFLFRPYLKEMKGGRIMKFRKFVDNIEEAKNFYIVNRDGEKKWGPGTEKEAHNSLFKTKKTAKKDEAKGLEVKELREMRGQGGSPEGTGGTDVCVCPECKKEFPHERGTPCNEMQCPDCKVALTGKGTVGSKASEGIIGYICSKCDKRFKKMPKKAKCPECGGKVTPEQDYSELDPSRHLKRK